MTQNAGKIDSGSEIGSDDGCAEIAQEQEHDDHRQCGAFEQRVDRRFIIAMREVDRRVDQLEVDVWVGPLELIDALLHRGGDDDVARAFRALDAERHDRLAVEPREGSPVGDCVRHDAKIIEAGPRPPSAG